MFDEAIFARMITDHRKNARGRERVPKSRESSAKPREFVVDRDANRLEAAGKIGGAASRTQGGPDGVHQVIAGVKGMMFAPPHDLPGQSRRARFVAVLPEDGGEFRHGRSAQEVRRGLRTHPPLPGARHPHVERNSRTKGEAARIGIELAGRDPKIEKNTIGVEGPDGGQCFG